MNSRRTSAASGDYPEHLNPFNEDDHKIQFWQQSTSKKPKKRSNSFSSLKDNSFIKTIRKSFRRKSKKEESKEKNEPKPQSPPRIRKHEVPPSPYTGGYRPETPQFAYPRSRFSERLTKEQLNADNVSICSRTSTNPFEDDKIGRRRTNRKKKAPPPPPPPNANSPARDTMNSSTNSLDVSIGSNLSEIKIEEEEREQSRHLTEQLQSFTDEIRKLTDEDDSVARREIETNLDREGESNRAEDVQVNSEEAEFNEGKGINVSETNSEADLKQEEISETQSKEDRGVDVPGTNLEENSRRVSETNLELESGADESVSSKTNGDLGKPYFTGESREVDTDLKEETKEDERVNVSETNAKDELMEVEAVKVSEAEEKEHYCKANVRATLAEPEPDEEDNDFESYLDNAYKPLSNDISNEVDEPPVPKLRKNKLTKSALLGTSSN